MMKRRILLLLLLVLAASSGLSPAAVPAAAPLSQAQVPLPAGTDEVLRVFAGKSIVVNSPDPFKRVSVTDDGVASAIVISPNQVLIHGLKPGTVTLLLWNEAEQMRSFDLQVLVDVRSLRETLQKILPGEQIQVSQSGATIVLTGVASTQEAADRAVALAKTEVPGAVSLITVPQQIIANSVILIQVRFAEVDRKALQELGINILSTGALNTPGTLSTGQFAPPGGNLNLRGSIPGSLRGATTTFQLNDLLNLFFFRPDLNLGATIRALEQKNLLQILAEPNLLALAGKEASFLAGGEFPVPIVQGGAIQTVSVQFKEFGVRLKFTATPMADGIIRLKVAPEVSTLDFANAVTLSGFLIPALATRKAETEVELRAGQSFAIAGLMDNRVTKIASKIPGLGDIPILGKLFHSRSFEQNNSELMVMVTPQVVKPLEPGQVPVRPEFPKPFLDNDKFDGKTGEVKNPAGAKP